MLRFCCNHLGDVLLSSVYLSLQLKENGEADWGLPFATLGWPADVQISSLGRFKSHELVEDTATNLEYLLYQAQMEYGKYRPSLESMLPNLAYHKEDSQLMSEYMVSIGTYVTQASVQFITGDLSLERD